MYVYRKTFDTFSSITQPFLEIAWKSCYFILFEFTTGSGESQKKKVYTDHCAAICTFCMAAWNLWLFDKFVFKEKHRENEMIMRQTMAKESRSSARCSDVYETNCGINEWLFRCRAPQTKQSKMYMCDCFLCCEFRHMIFEWVFFTRQ